MSKQSSAFKKELEKHIVSHYNLSGELKALQGEVDLNFKLKTNNGQRFTVKLSPGETDLKELDFRVQIMSHLASKALPFETPTIVLCQAKKAFQKININGAYILSIQTWLEGKPLNDVNPRTSLLYQNWGQTAGQLSKALSDFDHEFGHRTYKWDPAEIQHGFKLRAYLDHDQKQLVDYYWSSFEERVYPLSTQLRKSINYNDAHELNLLVEDKLIAPKISGVIDFADAIHTWTICELAIACAYASMNVLKPLEAIAEVVAGYHSVFPLEELELEVLFPIITSRLLLTLCHSAHNRHLHPENAYLNISESRAWEVLKKMKDIHPNFAAYTFRNACGRSANKKSGAFTTWTQSQTFSPIIKTSKSWKNIDLSVGSLSLGNSENYININKFNRNIKGQLVDPDQYIGYGGYLEIRPIYTSDNYLQHGNNGPEWRTMHLGMDIWDSAGTEVHTPLDGEVVLGRDTGIDNDYGPLLILKHKAKEIEFYTLYGHLSRRDVTEWEVGKRVAAGEIIGHIGTAPENGNWPPHLHFQVLLDLLEHQENFPGVAHIREKEIWNSICPNPLAFFPSIPQTNNSEDRKSSILNQRNKILGRSLSISYQEPLLIERGLGQYLMSATGRRYLDTVNNVAHVGHEHPKVVAAAQRQQAVLNTNTRYLHPNIVEYAEALVAKFPPELCVVHFVNSGSEANELAMRMAEAVTGSREMIALELGYHGNTAAAIDVSSYKFDSKGGNGKPAQTHLLPLPDTFRGRHRNIANAADQYANYIDEIIDDIHSQGKKVSGLIVESILSCGGQIEPPFGYFKKLYKKVRTAGGLCIADEVQVGFGRVGKKFWGFELQEVIPDIVTLGKPIGNGHPLGAVVCTEAVAKAFANGMEYFNTFGGNPVSCAIGKAVLDIIERENLQQNALELGDYLKNKLRGLKGKFPIISDVRGQGLFLGFELIKDTESMTPAAEATSYLANRMRELGFLMSTDGPDHNVIKIKPPMCITKRDIDNLLFYLEKALGEDGMKL